MRIFVHCSDSSWGDAEVIREWHTARGWSDIGYHYVILNGRLRGSLPYSVESDGLIQAGRPEHQIGAHVRGYNQDSLGVCLIGRDRFTAKQMYVLPLFLRILIGRFGVPVHKVLGHFEVDDSKTCPNIDMVRLRSRLCGSSY